VDLVKLAKIAISPVLGNSLAEFEVAFTNPVTHRARTEPVHFGDNRSDTKTEIGDLNARGSKLIGLDEAMESAVTRIANKNIVPGGVLPAARRLQQ